MKTDSNLDALFIQEEIRGERQITKVRFFLVLAFILFVFSNIRTYGRVTVSDKFAFVSLGVALLYCAVLWMLLSRGWYKRFIKYMSVTIDLMLIAISLAGYQFNDPAVQPTIFTAGRAMIFFSFIALAGLRYSFSASIWAGALAGLLYFLTTVVNLRGGSFLNPYLNTVFQFKNPFTGNTDTTRFVLSNEIYKSFYIFFVGLIIAFLSRNARRLLAKGISEESDKNLLRMEHKMLAASEQEQKKYLENISQGLLSFGPNLVIKEQFSAAVRPMFGCKRVDGMRFPDFLHRQDEKARINLQEYLHLMFTNTSASDDLLEAANPVAKLTHPHPERGDRHLAVSFKRVLRDSKIVELMAVVDDRTEAVLAERRYQAEKESHEQEIEIISAMLALERQDLEDFSAEAQQAIEESGELLSRLEADITSDVGESMQRVFRITHTLKGNAGNYGFRRLAETAHRLEDFFAFLRENRERLEAEQLGDAARTHARLADQFQSLHHLRRRIAGFSDEGEAGTCIEDDRGFNRFVVQMQNLCREMEKSLGKQVDLHTELGLDQVPPRLVSTIRNPVSHLLRNAIDHGLEHPADRMAEGKPVAGQVRLTVNMNEHGLQVMLADDGKGIDTRAVREKAVSLGLLAADAHPGRSQLLQILFQPGFTTKDSASTFSGRGVGLDAVKDMVQEAGGKLAISSTPGKGTTITLSYPCSVLAGKRQ